MTTYVFRFMLRHGHSIEDYIDDWRAGSKIIQQEPGARGTKLYRMSNRNVYYAVATWDSRSAREAMLEKLFKKVSDSFEAERLRILVKHEQHALIDCLGYDVATPEYNIELICEVNPPPDVMIQKTIQYGQEIAKEWPACRVTRTAELAPGVVAVEDVSGGCDALFDRSRWQYTIPRQWATPENRCGSPLLDDMGLGLLPGVGGMPTVKTIEKMVSFARKHLSAKVEVGWYETPRFFPSN
jgi:hypothetical protein